MTGASRWANAVASAGDPAHRATQDAQLDHRERRGPMLCGVEDRIDCVVGEAVEEPRPMDGQRATLAFLGELVDARVRHRHRHVGDRGRDLAEGLDRGLALGRVAAPDEHHSERQLTDALGRDERERWQTHQERDRRELLGCARGDRDEGPQDFLGGRHEERAAEDVTDRVHLVLEPGDDAEVPAAAADRPEQIGVRGLARDDLPAVGGDDLDSLERIDGEAVLADQPADPAAQCQAADADGSGVTERRREAVGRRRVRVLAGSQARLRPCEASIDVDVESLHRAEVEDDAAIVGAVAGQAVAAAADGEPPTGLSGEPDGPHDVGRVGGPDDDRGSAIGVGVVDEAGLLVVRASRGGRPSRAIRRRRRRGPMRRQGRGAGGGMLPSWLAPLGCIAGVGGHSDSRVEGPCGTPDEGRFGGMDIRRVRSLTGDEVAGERGQRRCLAALAAELRARVATARRKLYRGVSEIESGDATSPDRSNPAGTSSAPVRASIRPLSSSSMSVAWV